MSIKSLVLTSVLVTSLGSQVNAANSSKLQQPSQYHLPSTNQIAKRPRTIKANPEDCKAMGGTPLGGPNGQVCELKD